MNNPFKQNPQFPDSNLSVPLVRNRPEALMPSNILQNQIQFPPAESILGKRTPQDLMVQQFYRDLEKKVKVAEENFLRLSNISQQPLEQILENSYYSNQLNRSILANLSLQNELQNSMANYFNSSLGGGSNLNMASARSFEQQQQQMFPTQNKVIIPPNFDFNKENKFIWQNVDPATLDKRDNKQKEIQIPKFKPIDDLFKKGSPEGSVQSNPSKTQESVIYLPSSQPANSEPPQVDPPALADITKYFPEWDLRNIFDFLNSGLSIREFESTRRIIVKKRRRNRRRRSSSIFATIQAPELVGDEERLLKLEDNWTGICFG